MPAESIYSTTDLWLAAFLKIKGMRIARIEGEVRRAIFIFQDVEIREKLVQELYNGGEVSVIEIKNAMTSLKSAIFNRV